MYVMRCVLRNQPNGNNMIREFIVKDLELLEPNSDSHPDEVVYALTKDECWSYTLENNGIKAIITFVETAENEWAMSALISKYFNALDSRELKRFMERAVTALKPRKIWSWTASDIADRWHRFLGLVYEKKHEYRGKNYNVWVRHYEASGAS